MAERGQRGPYLEAIDWEVFDVATLTLAEVERMEAAIAPFFLTLTKREWLEGAEARRILGYAVADAADILADPQLAAREVWREVEAPELGRAVTLPGGWYRTA